LELEKHAQEGAKTFIEQTGEEHEPILLVETPEGTATGVFDEFNKDTRLMSPICRRTIGKRLL
jgi:hypothetical protein